MIEALNAVNSTKMFT